MYIQTRSYYCCCCYNILLNRTHHRKSVASKWRMKQKMQQLKNRTRKKQTKCEGKEYYQL